MKMNEMSRSEEKNYKLVDLIKFICAFLVIGIHTRQFLSVSDIADRLFYYDVSNYSVPFFYACSGYFLLAKKSNIKLGDRLKIRIKSPEIIFGMVTPLYTVDIVWLVHRRQLETFILVSLSAKFFLLGKTIIRGRYGI